MQILNLCLALFGLALGTMPGTGRAAANDAAGSNGNAPSKPIRALLLGVPHADVTPQMLVDRIAKQINVAFDIKTDWQDALRKPDFAKAYDVVVYCPCDPESRDMELVNNALRAARDGKGTVFIHGALHTFRHVPAWTELLGIRTITHDGYRELTIKRAGNDHPVLTDQPASWHTAGDELYTHEYGVKGVTPLLTAYSVQTTSDHVVAWAHTYGKGRVFGTSLGHDLKTVDATPYQILLARGLAWAANREYADVALAAIPVTSSSLHAAESSEGNVALATAGAQVTADSTGVFGRNDPTYGAADQDITPGRLIDGMWAANRLKPPWPGPHWTDV